MWSAIFMNFWLYVPAGAAIEKHQMKKPAFRVYAKETNMMVPWCAKRIPEPERTTMLLEITKEMELSKQKLESDIASNKVKPDFMDME